MFPVFGFPIHMGQGRTIRDGAVQFPVLVVGLKPARPDYGRAFLPWSVQFAVFPILL